MRSCFRSSLAIAASVGAGVLLWFGAPSPPADAALGPCDSDIAFNEEVACTVGSAGQTFELTFPGAVGDRIRVRVVKTSGAFDPVARIERPNGSHVCTNTTSDETTCVLDAAGTHSIVVGDNTGTQTGTLNIALQRLNNPVGCPNIAYSVAGMNGGLAESGELDCFKRQNVAVGDVLRVRLVETSGTPPLATIEVVRPNGTTLCAPDATTEVTCTADIAGTHHILVRDHFSTGTGNYRISLQRLNNPAGCTAIGWGGAPLAASVVAAAETDCYEIAGTAGDKARLRLVKTSGSVDPVVEVVRPDGTTACGASTADDVTCSLNVTGTYTLLVRDNSGPGTGDYRLARQLLNAPVGCPILAYGTGGTAGDLVNPGEMDCFRRPNVAVGDVLRIRVVETGGTPPLDTIEVIRPDGTTLCVPDATTQVTCTADSAGQHLIIVRDHFSTGTGPYIIGSQRLNNPAGCAVVGWGGAPLAAGIGAVVETDCYDLTAAAGDRARLRLVKTSGTFDPVVEVVRPDGTTVCNATTADESTCVLDVTGTYTLLVRDNSGPGIGDYTLGTQRLNAPVGCPSLAYGTGGTAGDLVNPGEMDCFRRPNVVVGDVLRIRVVETGGTPPLATIEVIRPDGTTLCVPDATTQVTCTADSAGQHLIIVRDHFSTGTGPYIIGLQRLSNPAGCSTIGWGGAPLAAAVAAVVETDCYELAASAGDRARLRLVKTSGTFDPVVEVVRPDGTTVCNATTADESTCVLDVTGTYTLLVRDNSGPGVGDYTLGTQRLNAPVGCVTIVYAVTGTGAALTDPGEMDCFRRGAQIGDRLRVRLVETGGTPPLATIEVLRPDGTTLCAPDATTEVTCTADTAGAQLIIVRDHFSTGTGPYTIAVQRLNDPAGCSATAYATGTVAGNVASVAETDCFLLPATSGDRARFRLVKIGAGTVDPVLEVVRPDGTTVCNATTADESTCLLDATGTHALFVRDNSGPGTGTYRLARQRLNPPVGCVNLAYATGGKNGALASSGEMDCFRRAAVAIGDVLRIRVVETGGTPPLDTIEVVRPDGTTRCAPDATTEVTCTADVAGDHYIIVRDHFSTGTGPYRIGLQRLNNPAGCAPVTWGGAPLATDITTVVETDCYRLAATAGDRARLRLVRTAGAGDPVIEVVRPNGTTKCTATTADESTCELDVTGTYTLLVRDNSGPGLFDYTLGTQRLNDPVGCPNLAYGPAATAGNLAVTGEMDCYRRQNVAVGDVLRVRVAETGGTPPLATIEVLRADGTTLCAPDASTEVTCTADSVGQYLIIVRDHFSTGTGTYALSLQRLNNPAGCTVIAYADPVLPATIGAAAETDCYRFTGASGDQARVRVVKTSGTFDPVREVVRPNGTTACAATTTDETVCALDTAGTFTILVRDNSGPGTGNYTIELDEV